MEEFMTRTAFILLLPTFLAFCLGGVCDADDEHADLRGRWPKSTVLRLKKENELSELYSLRQNIKTAKVDKANLIITESTRIIKEQDHNRVDVTFDDLKIGQLVEAQFVEGPTVMIYPLRVEAAKIVIQERGAN